MPSALVGLTAFSITLLLIGSVVYVSALPSMVVTGRRDSQLTPEEFDAALTSAQEELADDEAWPTTDVEEVASPDASASSGAADGGDTPALGGAGLVGPGDLAGDGSGEGQGQASGGGAQGNGAADQPATESGSGQVPTTAMPAPSPAEPDDPGAGDNPDPGEAYDAAKDERFHSMLVQKANALQGYVSETNGCVSAFQNDALSGSMATRQADLRAVESLESRVFNEYAALVNSTDHQNSTKWQSSYEALIRCYRLLYEYLSCYDDAWTINLGYDDPSAHVDEFMAPTKGAASKLESFESDRAQVIL